MSDAAKAPLAVTALDDGAVMRVCLDAGKGNVLDSAAMAAIEEVFDRLARETKVRAVVLTAAGKDFCFGASVPEHRPGEVEKMLPAFSRSLRAIAKSGLPVVAAVRGACLGGGLELALMAHRIVVAEDAKLGVPEVTLGVFPPVAAAILPLRCSQPVVDRLVATGEIVDGKTAVALGLADEAVPADQVEEMAVAWTSRYRKLSGVAVRFASLAGRMAFDEALGGRLDALERMYVDELMLSEDAKEGIAAFMERRKPVWKDR